MIKKLVGSPKIIDSSVPSKLWYFIASITQFDLSCPIQFKRHRGCSRLSHRAVPCNLRDIDAKCQNTLICYSDSLNICRWRYFTSPKISFVPNKVPTTSLNSNLHPTYLSRRPPTEQSGNRQVDGVDVPSFLPSARQ